MEKSFIFFFPFCKGNIVLLTDLELLPGGNAFGTVVKKAGHLGFDKIFSVTHGKGCGCVHNALGMDETVSGEIFFQPVLHA